ncbi:MAG: adenosylcobinamide-GDP ribazoletransferase [Thermodesulfovibrionales bacterium]|nr:adenosylcobinamide-GDP ribazoletransferase [Thermodesulfovibrionales bacterium]
MKNLILSIQFLTIIPISKGVKCDASDFHKIASYFPLVGLFQGLILLLSDLFFGNFFHPDLSIALMLFVYVLISGGFHLDALSDTFDGIAVRGDRDKKLSVMKDGSIGAIGVVAIIFDLALKYLAIRSVSNLLPIVYYSTLLFMPVISKWSMVTALYHGKAARQDGLGSLLVGKIRGVDFIFSSGFLVFLFLILILAPKIYVPWWHYIFLFVAFFVVYCVVRFLNYFYTKQFGGLTGDTVGSIGEITEVIFLIMVILWSRLFI